MSVFDDLGELSTELSSFSNTLYAVVLKAWEHVAETFDSERLEGLDLAQVKARLMAIITAHTQQLNVNIHNITPDQLNTYSETVVRQMVEELAELDTKLPYCSWDSQNFLPPMASSTFTSGVYETNQVGGGMCLEDNGDLAVLRNGTDGNIRGVFYSILEGAYRTTSPVLRNTNSQYRPPALGDNIPSHISFASKDTIVGRYCSANNPTPTGWFIGLTYGTFAQSEHSLVQVSFSQIPDAVSGFTIPVKDKVWFFTAAGLGEWNVYEFNNANIIAGNSTFVKLTGWTIKLSASSSITSDTFKFAATYRDLINFTGKDVSYSGMRDLCTVVTYDKNTDGSVNVRLRPLAQFGAVDGLGSYYRNNATIDVVLNGSKNIDSTWLMANKPTVDYTGVTISSTNRGLFAYSHPSPLITHGQGYEYIGRDRHYRIFYDNSTVRMSANIFTFDRNLRSSYVKTYAGLTGIVNVPVPINFPTNVGMSIHTACLTPTHALVESLSNTGNNISQCKLETGNIEEYTGISGHSVNGFKLNVDRVSSNVPISIFRKLVTEVNAVNRTMLTHSFSFSGGDGPTSNTELSGMSHSNILNYTVGAYTTTDVVRNKITSDLRASLVGSYPSLHHVSWTVVIPTGLVDTGPFIAFDFIVGDVDRQRSVFGGIAKITYSTSGTTVSSVNIQVATRALGPSVGSSALGFNGISSGNVSIRTCSDGSIIAVTSPSSVGFHGNTHTGLRTYRLVNGNFIVKQSMTIGYPGVTSLFNHPTLGLYVVYNSPLSQSDAGTKAVGRLYATTSSNPSDVGLATGPFISTDRVIVASEVPDKWTVYFSEEVECIINGVYGKVQPLIYSLNPAVDFWKVFHVWLKLENGTFKYVFERTEYELNLPNVNTDRTNSLYLGYFATNRYGIKVIALEKSIAIGGYRLSEWKAGKSIPVSNDFPMDLDTLNWV